MPLQQPPADGVLANIQADPLAGEILWRAWVRHPYDEPERPAPWFFESIDSNEPERSGRFSLPPEQGGTMHLARASAVAVLESVQDHLSNLPLEELGVRRIAKIVAPHDAPAAADMTDFSISAIATQELWGGLSHLLPQRWAAALRRIGWWAMSFPSRHASTGDPKSVALFNSKAGPTPPNQGGSWEYVEHPANTPEVQRALTARGAVILGPGNLEIVDSI